MAAPSIDREQRHAEVLRAFGRIERREGLHRDVRAHGFDVGDAWARRASGVLEHVPPRLRPGTIATRRFGAASATLRSRSRSDVVWFGKFDRAGATRARAFVEGRLAIKLQTEPTGRDGRGGLAAEARTRVEVDRLAPDLAPRLRAAGTDAAQGSSWIVEETLHGRHPWTPADVDAVADDVVEAVGGLYTASGVTSRPAASVLSPAFRHRLAAAAATEPRIAPHLAAADRLLAADRDLEVALGHGDLVGSNVLVCAGRVRLIDWEHAGPLAIAADVAKILVQAGDKGAAVAAVERHLGGHVGVRRSSYALRDQLLLAQLQGLSWHVARRRRAASVGREASFERDLQRRLAAVDALA